MMHFTDILMGWLAYQFAVLFLILVWFISEKTANEITRNVAFLWYKCTYRSVLWRASAMTSTEENECFQHFSQGTVYVSK